MALIVPPLPAPSLPSKMTTIRWPVCLTQSCNLQSSTCSLRSSFSYSFVFIGGLPPSTECLWFFTEHTPPNTPLNPLHETACRRAPPPPSKGGPHHRACTPIPVLST